MESKKKKKNSNLILITITGGVLLFGILLGIFLSGKSSGTSPLGNNLGEQQNQQTQSAVLQLASNLLGNTDNLNQLTRKPDGSAKSIQEIEEEFLISAFRPEQSPVGGIGGTLSPEVIERIWWELRPWIEEYLQDLNRSILEHAKEKFRRDVENWLKWQQKEYNRQLEEYQKRLQELKKIEDLIREYQRIREQELLDKISRKTELRNKGYIDRDIEKLREWNLLTPDQEIPDLTAEKRIGATNILWTSEREYGKIGGSSDLIIFLKPKAERIPQVKGNQNNSETVVNFSTEIAYKDEEGYKQFVRDYLTEKGKFNYDAYCLIRTNSSMSGDSAGIAYYLTLHSLINCIPLPRNLGSTGTVFERPKVGAIGGLNLKLEYNVKKEENPINIFILSEANRNIETYGKFNPGYEPKYPHKDSYENINFSSSYKEKIKQVHFISSVDQIEIALNEILKNPDKKIVHSCGKGEVPEKKPENPQPREPPKPEKPNSEITSEQFLTLITELSIRENKGENQDFWEKLQMAYGKNPNYQEAISQILRLQEEYSEEVQNGGKDNQKEIAELTDLQNKALNFLVKLEKTCEGEKESLLDLKEGKTKNQLDELCLLLKDNKWVQIPQEEMNDWQTILKDATGLWKGHKFGEKYFNFINGHFERARAQIEEQIPKKTNEKQILQEYQQKFQKIASSVANLTSEILTNLEKNGYTLTEIKWTGELQAPSLTAEPAVSFSLARKK